MQMPKVSRDSAPQRQEAGPVVDLRGDLDGYTATFTSLLEDIDARYDTKLWMRDLMEGAAYLPK
jgi:hypothetical protein